MQKIKPSPSGSGAKKKAYYLAEAMQFCLPFVRTSAPPSTGNLPEVPNCSDVNTDETLLESQILDDIPDDPSIESPQSPSIVQDNTSRSSPIIPIQPHTSSQPSSIPNEGKKRLTQKKKAAVEADQCFAAYFKAKTARLENSTTANDSNKKEALKMFLLSLIPELEELSDSQIKQFTRKVFTLIDEISGTSDVTPASPHSSISLISHQTGSNISAPPTSAGNYYTQFTQDIDANQFYFGCKLVAFETSSKLWLQTGRPVCGAGHTLDDFIAGISPNVLGPFYQIANIFTIAQRPRGCQKFPVDPSDCRQSRDRRAMRLPSVWGPSTNRAMSGVRACAPHLLLSDSPNPPSVDVVLPFVSRSACTLFVMVEEDSDVFVNVSEEQPTCVAEVGKQPANAEQEIDEGLSKNVIDKLFSNPSFLSDFIDVYENYPCLWQVSNKDYANNICKRKAYEELVKLCLRINPQANVDFVKKKIKNLRTVFKKELTKVQQSKSSGVGTEEVYVPKLWYFDKLLFTADDIMTRQSLSSIENEGMDTVTTNVSPNDVSYTEQEDTVSDAEK
ncbi:hypothetical protein J6590_102949, partial [Homalodisca vitripennis]